MMQTAKLLILALVAAVANGYGYNSGWYTPNRVDGIASTQHMPLVNDGGILLEDDFGYNDRNNHGGRWRDYGYNMGNNNYYRGGGDYYNMARRNRDTSYYYGGSSNRNYYNNRNSYYNDDYYYQGPYNNDYYNNGNRQRYRNYDGGYYGNEYYGYGDSRRGRYSY